jgi:hypothetical protein
MDPQKLRAWWSHRQGLDGNLEGKSPAEVLEQTGWARSIGGASPYLTLFARAATSRAAADAAVAALQIQELPSARGCTYVLPSSDYALGLIAGQGFADEVKTARKLGVTEDEIERLCEAIVRALQGGPLEPDRLREAAGNAVRKLGEEGKKKGLTTTLPAGLGRLQSRGEIRRVPTNGRLDQQRYRYALWRPNPLAKCRLTEEEARTELARRFFRWIGPATMAEFQWYAGLGAKAAKTAVEPLQLKSSGEDSDRLLFDEDLDALRDFKPPRHARYALVSSLDGISHLRRDVHGLLSEEDTRRKVFFERGAKEAGSLSDLENHAILDRGRLVGLWDFDVESASIVWMSSSRRTRTWSRPWHAQRDSCATSWGTRAVSVSTVRKAGRPESKRCAGCRRRNEAPQTPDPSVTRITWVAPSDDSLTARVPGGSATPSSSSAPIPRVAPRGFWTATR